MKILKFSNTSGNDRSFVSYVRRSVYIDNIHFVPVNTTLFPTDRVAV
jgi:hypothetical protein